MLVRESIDLWPTIREEVDIENEEMLLTEGRLSFPTSTDESRENGEYLDEGEKGVYTGSEGYIGFGYWSLFLRYDSSYKINFLKCISMLA